MSPLRAQGSAAEQPGGGAGARLHRAGVQRPWTPTLSAGGAAAGTPSPRGSARVPEPRLSTRVGHPAQAPPPLASPLCPGLQEPAWGPRPEPGCRLLEERWPRRTPAGRAQAPLGRLLHPGQPQLSSTGKRREAPPPRAGLVLREGRADAHLGRGQGRRPARALPPGATARAPSRWASLTPERPERRRGEGKGRSADTGLPDRSLSAHSTEAARLFPSAWGGPGRRRMGKLGHGTPGAGSSTPERLGRAEVPTEGRQGGRGAGDAGA